MIDQKFGSKRCRDTRKPPANQCPDVTFYQCQECGGLSFITGEAAKKEVEFICCQKKAKHLIPLDLDSCNKDIELNYKITGGYNDNAVEVSWNHFGSFDPPEWVYLKTFTGGYLKYINKTKRPPLVFSLADTDAFAYCDESPCLECVFRCKRGFVLYAYFRQIGLIAVALDKMTAQWQSDAKK